MGKKTNRSVKKRRIVVAPSSDLDEDMSSGEKETKDVKEGDNEQKPYLTLNGTNSDSEESNDAEDSDKELQVALKEGLLKSDKLNYIVEKKRPIINKVAELRAKLAEVEKKLPWLETLDVSVANDTMDPKAVDDDFEREIVFYKQAQEAVQTAIPRLLKMGIKVFRPSDYYAEMAKSDEHMQKVRKRMLDLQQGKERQEAIRRLREEKKFAAKVQKEVLENRQSEKRKLLEAVKRHRKGMKSQLDDMLNNAKRLQRDEAEEENEIKREREAKKRNRQEGRGNLPMRLGRRMGRTARDKKYGFGGQKKRSKRNDKQSFNEFSSHAMRNSRRGSGKPTSGRGRFRGIKRR